MHKKIMMVIMVSVLCWVPGVSASETVGLVTAIQTALVNNPAIKEAEEREKSAGETLKSSRADFLPKASANYSYTHLEDEPFQRVGGQKAIVGDTDNYHWDVTLVQPLFTGFGLSSRYKMSKADVEIGRLGLEMARQDVIRDVKTAYFEALLASRIEKVAVDKVKTLESQEKDSQGFFDNGIIPKNDLLKSKIAKASAVQELEKARADARIALSRLSLIMGNPLDAELTLESLEPQVSTQGDMGFLIDEGLKNRPELRIMARNLEKYDRSIRLKQSAYYPDLSLVGRYEQNGDDPGARENDFTNDHNSSVSVQARWTFFEWGKSRADVAGSRYDRTSFAQKIRGAEDQVRLEIKREYLNVSVWEKNITTAKEALDQAQENFRITKFQYLQHVTTATEVLDAQTYLSGAETGYYKALYGYMIARARLDRAVGRKVVWEN